MRSHDDVAIVRPHQQPPAPQRLHRALYIGRRQLEPLGELRGRRAAELADVADVPLNDTERHNVSAIKTAEANKGC